MAKGPRVVVDGNDGTGKSTLAAALQARGYAVRDRGAPTKMTDEGVPAPGSAALLALCPADEVYLVLDAPVAVCRARLAAAGKDLDERYHTEEDLAHYRERFLAVARALPRCALVDASGTREETLARSLAALADLAGQA